MTPPPTPARRGLAVVVGLFALWQVVYLPAANLIDSVPRRPGPHDNNPSLDPFQQWGRFTDSEPLQRSAEVVGDVIDFWSELTGQEQGWRLFVPGNPPHTLFPAVELRFADGEVVEVRSKYEPADWVTPPPRPPLVNNRLFNYEMQFAVPGWFCGEDHDRVAAAVFLPETVRDNHPRILAWLRWHAETYRRANPGHAAPTAVVLNYRYVPTPDPRGGRGWTGRVYERPYCRWRPGAVLPAGALMLEVFDPATNQYRTVTAGANHEP